MENQINVTSVATPTNGNETDGNTTNVEGKMHRITSVTSHESETDVDDMFSDNTQDVTNGIR